MQPWERLILRNPVLEREVLLFFSYFLNKVPMIECNYIPSRPPGYIDLLQSPTHQWEDSSRSHG